MDKMFFKTLFQPKTVLTVLIYNLAADFIASYYYKKSPEVIYLVEKFFNTSQDIFFLMIWLGLNAFVLYKVCDSIKTDFSKFGLFYMIRVKRSEYFWNKIFSVSVFLLCVSAMTALQSFLTFRAMRIPLESLFLFQAFLYQFCFFIVAGMLSLALMSALNKPEIVFYIVVSAAVVSKLLLNASRFKIECTDSGLERFWPHMAVYGLLACLFTVVFYARIKQCDLNLIKIKE